MQNKTTDTTAGAPWLARIGKGLHVTVFASAKKGRKGLLDDLLAVGCTVRMIDPFLDHCEPSTSSHEKDLHALFDAAGSDVLVLDIPSRSRRPIEGRYLEELCPTESDAFAAAVIAECMAVSNVPFGIATDPMDPWREPGRDPEYKQIELCDQDDLKILLARARAHRDDED